MYGTDTALIYDLQHVSRGKDFGAEARTVAEQIRARVPAASSLLDVACGTGGHLVHFATLFDEVEGLDLSAPMLEVARAKLPGTVLQRCDMRDFDLGRRYDAVTCCFASIAYVTSAAELDAAVHCLARHTVPGGVVAVEPWWFPETFVDRHLAPDVIEIDGRAIARMSHTVRDGDASRMEAHYVVADPLSGTRYFAETHRAMLFPRARYERAFVRAGLEPEYVEGVQCGRGLFVGTRTQAALQ